jgi:putative tricarboxylic transport membrane protein
MTICLAFGVLGFALKKADYPIAPLVLGVILGGMLEENFRRAVKLARGDYTVFLTKPISLLFILLAILSIVVPLVKKKRS